MRGVATMEETTAIAVMEVTLDAYNDPECEGDLIKIYRKYGACIPAPYREDRQKASIFMLDAAIWRIGEFMEEMMGIESSDNGGYKDAIPLLNIVLGYFPYAGTGKDRAAIRAQMEKEYG